MSYNMLMVRTKTNSEPIEEIKSEDIIPFRQTEIAGEIKKIAAELGAGYDCDNLSWQWLGSIADSKPVWHMEFGLDENEETEAVMLCLRGMVPEEVFDALVADLNIRIIEQ